MHTPDMENTYKHVMVTQESSCIATSFMTGNSSLATRV